MEGWPQIRGFISHYFNLVGTKVSGHYRGVAILAVWHNVHVHGLIDSVYDKRICNYMYMYMYMCTWKILNL